MTAESPSAPMRVAHAPSGPLITRGADAVVLAEELFLSLFTLTACFSLAAAALSIWFGVVAAHHSSALLTILFAALGGTFAATGVARRRATYRWLRRSPVRPLAPAGLGAVAMVVNGPDSPTWWLALALLLLVATVAPVAVALAAATVNAAAYLAGTAIGGQALTNHGDAGVLPGAVGLIAYTIVACFVADVFARFVAMLHRLEREEAPAAPSLKVPNLAQRPAPQEPPTTPAGATPARSRRGGGGRLTARQLEAALLARDGLRQTEIAACLGISTRQVERLLSEARTRSGAATTSHLVAMLVADGIAPAQES